MAIAADQESNMATRNTAVKRASRERDVEAPARSDREHSADAQRESEDLLSEDEMREMIRSEFTQEQLPQLKPPAGWHYCWLSTTSQNDPIHKRMRVGYRPVSFAELSESGQAGEFSRLNTATGEFADCVSCNEMVLFKIVEERYQLIMREFHHHMPLGEEQSIRANATPNERDSKGKKLVDFDDEDDGMQTLGVAPKVVPTFA
jgi:hypothetical protein